MSVGETERYVIAVDLGTSGPKVAVVSESGMLKSTAARPVDIIFTPDGGTEHDPEAVWRAVVEACREAIHEANVPKDRIAAVICDSHYASLIPVDASGNALMNLIVWMDQRAAKRKLEVFPEYRPDSPWKQFQWLRIHGIPPLPSGADNISRIRWIRLAHPEVYEKTAAFLEPMDYITARLCGRITANQCSSFMIQLMDNRRVGETDYNETLLRYAGIGREHLAELVPIDAVLGTLSKASAEALGLNADTKVITGINDTQAVAIACGAFQGDHAGVGIGTSSAMFSHGNKKKTDIRTGIFTQPAPTGTGYTITGENGIAGKALEHFLERIVFAADRLADHTVVDRFATLDTAVESTKPGAGGVVFLPWIGGSIAPVSDNDVRGGFLNISLNTSREMLARAVLEGVALNFRWLGNEAERIAQRRYSHYVFYGGGAQSAVWNRILADVLGAPVHRFKYPRYAGAYGTARLACQRLGLVDFDTIAKTAPVSDAIDPNPDYAQLYADRFEVFKSAFEQNRSIFHQLNRNSSNANENE